MPKPSAPDFTPALQLALVAEGPVEPWIFIPARMNQWQPVFVSNCPKAERLAATKRALRQEGFWVEECTAPRFN